jgi:hypothetical protein
VETVGPKLPQSWSTIGPKKVKVAITALIVMVEATMHKAKMDATNFAINFFGSILVQIWSKIKKLMH